MSATITKTERQEALDRLHGWLTPGDTLYTILRHRAASGLSRVISVIKIGKDGNPLALDWNISKALGYSIDKRHEGLRVQGGGMDMGFEVVYNLGSALWPSGTPTPHGTRNGSPDSTGGYALKQRWL